MPQILGNNNGQPYHNIQCLKTPNIKWVQILYFAFINRCYVLVSGSVSCGKYAKKYSVRFKSDVGACVGSFTALRPRYTHSKVFFFSSDVVLCNSIQICTVPCECIHTP